jgi:hypothetical protein
LPSISTTTSLVAELDHAAVAQTQKQARVAASRDFVVVFQFGADGKRLTFSIAKDPRRQLDGFNYGIGRGLQEIGRKK